MIYRTPTIEREDADVLALIDELRGQLTWYLRTPRRWYGTLRRATLARAVQGSNTIEGYHASVEDVAAMIDDEEPLDADEGTRHAIAGYRDAMTYVLQLAGSRPLAPLDESLVKSMHFMMLKHDLAAHPGQWRPRAVWIEDPQGRAVYEAPARDGLEDLVDEMLTAVNQDTSPAIVRAAMAHLNLTLIHPFSDGNGRMARCLQSYVLATDGVVSPEFLSIEEYLGRNTEAYYAVLTEVAQGAWSPTRDASPWLRFCLTAHYRQARTLLRRIDETEALWDRCEQLVRELGLPDRSVAALTDAARGWRLHRSLYLKAAETTAGEEISTHTATRDLRALVDAGLLVAVGERRGRSYQPSDRLRGLWTEIRGLRPARGGNDDPYLVVRSLTEPRLPGIAP